MGGMEFEIGFENEAAETESFLQQEEEEDEAAAVAVVDRKELKIVGRAAADERELQHHQTDILGNAIAACRRQEMTTLFKGFNFKIFSIQDEETDFEPAPGDG